MPGCSATTDEMKRWEERSARRSSSVVRPSGVAAGTAPPTFSRLFSWEYPTPLMCAVCGGEETVGCVAPPVTNSNPASSKAIVHRRPVSLFGWVIRSCMSIFNQFNGAAKRGTRSISIQAPMRLLPRTRIIWSLFLGISLEAGTPLPSDPGSFLFFANPRKPWYYRGSVCKGKLLIGQQVPGSYPQDPKDSHVFSRILHLTT